MKTIIPLSVALALCAVAQAQPVDSKPGGAAPAAIPYATLQVIAPGDSGAVIAERAAKVLPRPNQTAWMRLDRTFFIHFGHRKGRPSPNRPESLQMKR